MSRPRIGVKAWPEYAVWKRMIQRCHNPKCDKFASYGARGIRVSPEWRASFETFITDMGRRPTSEHELDRIDNNGDYKRGNVRWVTHEENMNNTRASKVHTLNGVAMTQAQWARHLGMHASTLCVRLQRMPFDEAVRPYLGR